MALINQNSIIGVTSITSPSASNVLTVHTNDTTERLRVSTSGVSFSGTNASLDTSGNLTVGGNISIGGTLTYEDVTNIDSVGIITARSGVSVPDGQKIQLGNSNDLQIYHTGSHSLIDEAGTGNLVIRSNLISFEKYTNEQLARFTADGSCEFYYDNSKKLETTNTGATITNDLVLNHASGDKAIRWATGGTNKWSLYHNNGAGALVAYDNANNAERLRITSNGDLMTGGITSGAGKVQVGGGLRIAGSATHTDTPSPYLYRTSGADNLCISTSALERLRIDSSGRLLKSGQASLTSTTLSYPIQVAAASDANAIAIFGRAADDIGELAFYEADKSTKLGELQYRQDHLNFRHRVGDIRFATGGTTERLRINSAGQMILGTASNLGTVPPKFTIVNDTNSSTFSACQLLRLNGPGAVGERGGIGFHYANSLNHGEKPSSFIGVETVASGGAQQTDLLFATRPNTNDVEPTERLRITSGGNIGINCNSPGSMLELNAAAGTKMGISLGAVGDSITASRYIGICKSADQTDLGANSGFSGIEFGGPYSTDEGYIAFHTHDLGVESGERIRLTKDGKFGVGLTSPESKVQIRNTTTHGKDTYATANTGGSQTPPTGTFKWDNVTPVAGHGRGYEAWVQSGDAYPNASNYIDVLIRNAGFYRITLKRSHSSADAAVCQMLIYGLANSGNSNYPVVHMNGAMGSGTSTATVQSGNGRGSSNAVASFYWEIHSYNVNTHDSIIRITTTGSNNQGIVALIEEI